MKNNKYGIKTINSQKVFNILWYLLLINTELGIINGTISIILFSLEISNVFVERMNLTIFPLILIILVFLLFFYPEFYKNRKNVKFKFISKDHSLMAKIDKTQITKDFLFGDLFISVEIFLTLFIIITWIPETFKSFIWSFPFYYPLIILIIFNIIVIGIIFNKILLKSFSLYIIYSSMVVGVIFPMLFIFGIFSITFFFYPISWIFADPSVLWKDIRVCWLNYPLCITLNYELMVIIIVLIFLFGLILFLISLAQLVYGLRKKQSLVQVGIYKYIRHPQNLGIIIMVLSYALYAYRIGDLVSWVQFFFLMIIYSDNGDILLKKKYPEQFQQYYQNTGYMFPKLFSRNLTRRISVFHNKKARYGLLFVSYVATIGLSYLYYLIIFYTHYLPYSASFFG